jgi:hypothetical protein
MVSELPTGGSSVGTEQLCSIDDHKNSALQRLARILLSPGTVVLLIVAFPLSLICGHHLQRLRAMSQIEDAGGKVSFRTNAGVIPHPIDLKVRLRHNVDCIYLASSKLDASTLGLLPTLREAKFVSFNSSKFTDEHVEYLNGMHQLKELQLNGTEITDVGLERLCSSHQLTQLTLNDTKITDASLSALGTQTSLKKLTLYHTCLTERTVTALQTKLPGCEILHSGLKSRGSSSD